MRTRSKAYAGFLALVLTALLSPPVVAGGKHDPKPAPPRSHPAPKAPQQAQGQAQGQLQGQAQGQQQTSQTDSRATSISESISENHSNQEVHVGANAQGGDATASTSGSVDNNIGGDVDYGDDYDFPVASAAVTYAGNCSHVLNAQTPNFGIGTSNSDRVCQWLNLAQARHLEAASMVCTVPQVGKGGSASSFDVAEYKYGAQQRKRLWIEGDTYMKNAASEMCSKGILKHLWGAIWSGTSKCIDVEVGGQKPSTASVDPVTGVSRSKAPIITSVE